MKQRTAAARARVARAAKDRQGTVIASAAAAAVGFAERKGYALPTVGGVEPTLLYGALIAFGGPMVVKGSAGKMLESAGEGLLAVAAYKFGTGQPVLSMSGDDDGGGQWADVP